MKFFAEKEAEAFLKEEGFEVITSFFIESKNDVLPIIEGIPKPVVMKVSGRKIVHKHSLGGVKTGINDSAAAVEAFGDLMKIRHSEGVIVQPQISGRELLFGVKKTPEFGHVLAFGIGGTDVEKLKKIVFRVFPLDEKEITKMIKELNIQFSKPELLFIIDNITKLYSLIQKYPNIIELDINPLILNPGMAIIVDARISFD